MKNRVATDKAEQNILNHIRDFGWSIMHIFDPESKQPAYSFSIGMFDTLNSPEIVIFSLERSNAQTIINDIGQKIKDGLKIEIGRKYDLFFKEPCVCAFVTVNKRHFPPYLGSAMWYYGGDDFQAFQCVWSDEKGILPWEPGFNTALNVSQPLLNTA